MTDRPILFSGPMIRANQEERKTKTRRILNRARVLATPETRGFTLQGNELSRALQNASGFRRIEGDIWFWESDAYEWQMPASRTGWLASIGYAPGDRLWVRETWCPANSDDGPCVLYKADGYRWYPAFDGEDYGAGPSFDYAKFPAGSNAWSSWAADVEAGVENAYRPSIFMPRWVSRLTLVVTDVRVQRLQDISEDDAIAEGILVGHPLNVVPGSEGDIFHDGVTDPIDGWTRDPVQAFQSLWTSINGVGAWDANPWVVVLTYTVHRCNIDQMEAA